MRCGLVLWLLASCEGKGADHTPESDPDTDSDSDSDSDTDTDSDTDADTATPTEPAPLEVCDDEIDNDKDGLGDCWDPDCEPLPICDHPAIAGTVEAADLELSIYGGYDEFFGAVVSLGDVTGDGLPDLVAVAPNRVLGNGEGVASVFQGPLARGSLLDDDATVSLSGASSFYAAHSAGDYTGDGLNDLVLAGYVLSAVLVLQAPVAPGPASPAAVATLTEMGFDAYIMTSFAGPTDFDGDGSSELWIAGLGGYFDDEVIVWVAEGPLVGNASIWSLPDRVDGTIDQPLGNQAAATADFDGDGMDDVALPAPYAFGFDGAVFIFSHVPVGVEGTRAADAELRAASVGGQAGSAAVDAGDVNGDGYTDLAVGAIGQGDGGAIYVMAGPVSSANLDTALTTIEGLAGESLGQLLTATGDIDGDGALEILAVDSDDGTFPYEFTNYILDLGAAGVFSRPTVTDMQINDAAQEALGVGAAGGLDLDDDGLPDLAMGGFYGSAVYVLFGSNM